MNEQAAPKKTLIVGLGQTGLSCLQFLNGACRLLTIDSRQSPPGLQAFNQGAFDTDFQWGSLELSDRDLDTIERAVVSPGVDRRIALFDRLAERKVPIVGDVELFLREVTQPVVAVTGSNGKSSVTDWIGHMIDLCANKKASVGGNIGLPVLSMLDAVAPDLYVLELSSFQLELIHSLQAKVAVVLNISEDHMDRYDSFAQYRAAKLKIFNRCEVAVVNFDDNAGYQYDQDNSIYFGHDPRIMTSSNLYVTCQADHFVINGERWMPAAHLKVPGQHNITNAMAVIATGLALGIDRQVIEEALRSYGGLAHRCQLVRTLNNINWVNDSKATNVGSAEAALKGLSPKPKAIIWIAGGDGKHADFFSLGPAVKEHVKFAIFLGADGAKMAQQLGEFAPFQRVDSLLEAVMLARSKASSGDTVLLSPACASFDMFDGFEHRGHVFSQHVEAL